MTEISEMGFQGIKKYTQFPVVLSLKHMQPCFIKNLQIRHVTLDFCRVKTDLSLKIFSMIFPKIRSEKDTFVPTCVALSLIRLPRFQKFE